MRITTAYPASARPGQLAWFVRSLIEGMAAGCQPVFGGWALPPLYSSGVRFELEAGHGTGHELFDLPPTVYRRGHGDCDDLVIWRLLELWQGIPTSELATLIAADRVARCRCEWHGRNLHVSIRMPNGSTEDPARILE